MFEDGFVIKVVILNRLKKLNVVNENMVKKFLFLLCDLGLVFVMMIDYEVESSIGVI